MNKQEAMKPPPDSVMVEFKAQLPDVFRQENRYYFKDQMPNNPQDKLAIWYQPVEQSIADKAKQLRAQKLAFESEYGQLFL